MSNTEERLFIAKHELCESLGDITMMVYLSHLKMWFRKLWSKEQFDFECRQILTSEQQHLHNEFFLAILNKITLPLFPESANKTVTAKKRKRRTGSERSVFEPVELFDYLPEEGDDLPSSSASPHQPRFAADELFLPDTSLIMGRLLVIAWENGLSGVDDNTCEIMVQAVQTLLKNILTAIIKARKNFRSTNCGRFIYDIGCTYESPATRNTIRRKIADDIPFEVDDDIASATVTYPNSFSFFTARCENVDQLPLRNLPITIRELYMALQDKNIIPCHSVYASNIERISQLLN